MLWHSWYSHLPLNEFCLFSDLPLFVYVRACFLFVVVVVAPMAVLGGGRGLMMLELVLPHSSHLPPDKLCLSCDRPYRVCVVFRKRNIG